MALPENTIPKVLEYYLTNHEYQDEVVFAIGKFFDRPCLVSGGKLEIAESGENYFNEWFIFDFILGNGKTVIEDYCDRNPHKLGEGDVKLYKDLVKTNIYDFFEVLKVDIVKGLNIYGLKTGKKYYVYEYAGTLSLNDRECFFGRVAKVGEHWELVGADSMKFPMELNRKNRKAFLKDKETVINPKFVYELLIGKLFDDENRSNEEDVKKYTSMKESDIESEIKKILVKTGLYKNFTLETIKQWITESMESDNENIILLSMLYGLTEGVIERTDREKLVGASIGLYNILNKTFLNKDDSIKKSNKEIKIDSKGWHKHNEVAHNLRMKNKFEKSLEAYNKFFEEILKGKSCYLEVYRVFANKAIIHFYLGEEYIALKLLEIALELNPNYDFAITLLQNHKNGEYKDIVSNGAEYRMSKKAMKRFKEIKKSGIEKAERWSVDKILKKLEDFNINFTEEEFMVKARVAGSYSNFVKEYLIVANKEDNYFVGELGYNLWQKLCGDILCFDNFSSLIDVLEDLIYEGKLSSDKIREKLVELEEYIKSPDCKEIFSGLGNYEMEKLKWEFLELLQSLWRKYVLELADNFREKTGFEIFGIVKICDDILNGGNVSWEYFEDIKNKEPYNWQIFVDVGNYYDKIKDKQSAEKFYLEALGAVEKRERDGKYDLTRNNTIYSDYEGVFDVLECFYEDYDKTKYDDIARKKEEIKKRKKGLEYSKRNDKIMEMLDDFVCDEGKKEFEKDPAKIYYEWIRKYNINFATETLTSSVASELRNGELRRVVTNSDNQSDKKKKIGRNEPCPCGSGKKFKKCCGR